MTTQVSTAVAEWPTSEGGGVTSVNGQVGDVVLGATDVGADIAGAAAVVAAATIPLVEKAAANGVATLDSGGDIPLEQLGNVPGVTGDALTRFVAGGGEVVASRPGICATPAFSSGATNFVTNIQSAHAIIRAADTVRLYYRNGHHEIANDNAISIRAQISLGAAGAGTFVPVFFRGARLCTLDPDGTVLSDPVFVGKAAGEQIFVHTWQQAADGASGKYLINHNTFLTGEFGNNATADQTGSQLTTGSVGGLMPMYILAGQSAVTSKAMFGFFGDSIIDGKHDTNQEGWAARAIKGSYGYLQAGLSSETMQSFVSSANSYKRLQLMDGITAALCHYPINDIAGGRSLAQLQADFASMNTIMRRAGARKVTWATALPKTTSTDSWATAANQTPFGQESVRVAWNNWLRTQAGGAVDFVFDAADVVEVNAAGTPTQNGGRFGATYASAPAGGGGGADGVHPTIAGHLALATAFQGFLVTNPTALGV